MAENSDIILNLLQILGAVGAFKGIEILIKYLKNRKKIKTDDSKDLYEKYSESCDRYIKQTAEFEETIIELRNSNIEMQCKMFEMNKKLDAKNDIITSLKEEISKLTEKIVDNTKVITELIQRTEVLENIKCEREGCENRIPPEKTIRIKA